MEYESFVVPDESAASSLSSYGLAACVYRKLWQSAEPALGRDWTAEG